MGKPGDPRVRAKLLYEHYRAGGYKFSAIHQRPQPLIFTLAQNVGERHEKFPPRSLARVRP